MDKGKGLLKAVGSAKQYYYRTICNVSDEDVPDEYILPYLPTLLDQESIQSCVAHSLAEILQVANKQQTDETIDLSVLEIYGLWRGDSWTGEGMFTETTFNNGRKIGTCDRKLAPENIEVMEAIYKAKEYLEKYPKEFIYKIGSFYRIKKDEEFFTYLKKALLQFNLPIFVTTMNGTHAEVAVGWTKDGELILQNSWGEYAGTDKGLHRYSPDSIGEAYLITMEDVKVPFEDIKGHWAEKHIRNAYFAGYLNGRTESTFEPEGFIKRGEVAKLLDELITSYDEKIKALEDRLRKVE